MTFSLEQLKAVAACCRTHGAPHYYRDWSLLTLLEYLNFHAQQGTLVVIRPSATTIAGVGVAWQDEWAAVTARAVHQRLFAWQPDNPAGDCLVIGHVFVTGPGPGPLRAMARWVLTRWPHWARLRLVTLRRVRGGGHRFREYPVRMIGRLAQLEGQTI